MCLQQMMLLMVATTDDVGVHATICFLVLLASWNQLILLNLCDGIVEEVLQYFISFFLPCMLLKVIFIEMFLVTKRLWCFPNDFFFSKVYSKCRQKMQTNYYNYFKILKKLQEWQNLRLTIACTLSFFIRSLKWRQSFLLTMVRFYFSCI